MFGKIVGFKQVGETVLIEFEHKSGSIEVINDAVMNVFALFDAKVYHSMAIEDMKKEPCQVYVIRSERGIEISTSLLKAVVTDDFKVDFYEVETNTLLCEDYRGGRAPFVRHGNGHIAEEEGLSTEKTAARHKIEVVKTMFGDEHFYGLGDKTGHLNKKGYAYEMWNTDDPTPHVESNKSLYKSIPFFMTLRQNSVFGIFFDNTHKTFFDMGKENAEYYYFGADEGHLNYYFIYGMQPADVVRRYTDLTGKTPLPQKWTLGYQQSRFSYATQERVEELIEKFRTLDIPCDVIHLDIHHLDEFKVFTFNPTGYHSPKAIIDKALAAGIKLIPIVDPGVKKEAGYDLFEEGLANGYFATDADGIPYVNRVWPGDALYPDYSNPEAREWWGNHHKKLTDLGIEGIWTDMNEPSSFNGPLPDDVQFAGGKHTEIHNVYGHLMSQATFEGMKKLTNKRPFVITRAAYAGTQKYSTVWTGDNQSFWDHLRLAIPQQLNLGLSGFSFVGTDIGGFSSDTTKELLCRWIQVGIFSPLCRNHASDHTRDQEPWAFDEETLTINRKFIKLRYKLIPYLYDLLWQGEKTGLPVMRPLFMHYPQDEVVKNLNTQFLVGENMLVAPVVTQGETYRMVYLPKGSWYDYETNEVHAGNQMLIKHAPLDTCPIFIKAGAIIPNDMPKAYVDEFKSETLILDVYPGEGVYDHIEDDAQTFEYRHGVYNHYRFMQCNKKMTIEKVHSQYEVSYESFKVIYHDVTVSEVLVDGVSIPFECVGGSIEFVVSSQALVVEFK